MAEQMSQPNLNQPDQQPPKMPEQTVPAKPRHTHTGFWIMGAILAVLVLALVAVAVFLFQGQTEVEEDRTSLEDQIEQLESELEAEQQEVEEAQMALEDLEASVPPVLYTRLADEGFAFELHEIDRQTAEDTLLVTFGGEDGAAYDLYAVPQVNYDGNVYMNLVVEGDFLGLQLVELDMESLETSELDYVEDFPFVRSAIALHPDQRQIAMIYDNPSFDETSKEVVILNLQTGEREVIGSLPDNESFASSYFGFAGVEGINVTWADQDCVEATVYSIPEATDVDAPQTHPYKTRRLFCRE